MKVVYQAHFATPESVLFKTINKPVTKTNSFFLCQVGVLAYLAAKGVMLYCRPTVWIGAGFHDRTGRRARDAFLFVSTVL